MTKQFPLVYIIILNWNGLEDTLECLDSIRKCSYENYQVLVIDNGSTDDSVSAIQSACPWVTIIQNSHNFGFTGGNNVGIRYALQKKADYVWLLNNDTVVEADTLSSMITLAESERSIGMVSPIIYFYYEPNVIQCKACYFDAISSAVIEFDAVDSDAMINPNIVLYGTALLIKKAVIASVGFLDERFFAYAEDADYSVRVLKEGYRNAISQSRIFHKGSGATKSPTSPLKTYLLVRNRYLFWSKYWRKSKFSLFRKYTGYTVSKLGSVKHINPDAVTAGIEGYYDALSGRYGPYESTLRNLKYKSILLFMISWHPFFFAHVLSGEYKEIGTITMNRFINKIDAMLKSMLKKSRV